MGPPATQPKSTALFEPISMSSRLENPKTDSTVKSPLHRLETEMARDMPFAVHDHHAIHSQSPSKRPGDFDTDSIYSFDSVSTNGRLLDRLDLESEDYDYEDEYLRRRGSYVLVQSTGRLLDRLGLDDNEDESLSGLNAQSSQFPDRYKPIRANSAFSLERMRQANSTARGPARALSTNGSIPVKSTFKVAQMGNYSVNSLLADIASHHGSSSSLTQELPSLPHTPMRFNSVRSLASESSVAESSGDDEKNASVTSLPTIDGTFPSQVARSPMARFNVRNVSTTSTASSASLDVLFNPNLKFDPTLEILTKQAMQQRALGNHREASYQLQTAANIPNNYPKAMHLYALALHFGHGVRLNEQQSIKWLCRCILVSYILETATIDTTSLSNYVTKLNELHLEEMVSLVKRNLSLETNDPFDLYDRFLALPLSSVGKIVANNIKDNNTVAAAYHQLGKGMILGLGVAKDEPAGMLFLAKAGSLGYGDSMTQLGELWNSKTKHHKKDLTMAAAWLRLGELFGQKDIGNSWIYKEKYLGTKNRKR